MCDDMVISKKKISHFNYFECSYIAIDISHNILYNYI